MVSADASLFVTSTRAAASRFFRNAACFARMSRSLVSFRNSAESSVEEIRPATLALFAYRGFEDQCRSSGCLPDRCSLASMAFASVRSRYARNARSASRAGISSTMSSAEKSAMVVVASAIGFDPEKAERDAIGDASARANHVTARLDSNPGG